MRTLLPVFLILSVVVPVHSAIAAVSCTLERPDRDVKRLWPQATTYKVRELIPARHGKKDLFRKIQKELGVPLDKEFETPDTPYTFYAVYKGSEHVGLIIGNNYRMAKGPVQTFLVYDRRGQIKDVYVQKISSDDALAFRSKYYRQQFYKFNVANMIEEVEVLPPVRSPTSETIKDHHAFVRAVQFNMLLVKHFYNAFKE